jgi:hypothetical protein
MDITAFAVSSDYAVITYSVSEEKMKMWKID